MKRLTPIARIAFGLSCVSMSLLLAGATIGVVPDQRAATLEKRRAVAENLAVSCSLFASQGSVDGIRTSLGESVRRDPDLLSATLRRADGSVWLDVRSAVANTPGHTRTTQVNVPIVTGKRRWGELELDFHPLTHGGLWGWATHPVAVLVLVIGSFSFVAFYFYLRTTLQYLDPSKVMPERVRQTLDTVAGGLMVVDDQERIVHTNQAFSRLVGQSDGELRGQFASKLPWCLAEDGSDASLPWSKAIQKGIFETGVKLGLEVKGLGNRTFLVNTSSILDDQGRTRGALVSLDDVTALEASRTELRKMLDKLKHSRDEIQRQNRELEELVNIDPLTSCLNRRAFYRELETIWTSVNHSENTLSCIMIDVDYFKAVNDRYGHGMGDNVLRHVASTICSQVRDVDLVCRYGGEEFCVLLPHADISEASQLAERCREAIEVSACEGLSVTASLGVSALEFRASDPHELLDQADAALYAAKRGGRNQVVSWTESMQRRSTSDRESVADQEKGTDTEYSHIPFPAVSALMSALSYRDPGTAEHGRRVADLCSKLAKGLMSPSEMYVLETAALLHDVGKIGIPDAVLGKPGRLNEEEWAIMQQHNEIGAAIIKESFGSEQLVEFVGAHHTWYASAPEGDGIPLGARILAIAEAYDTMVSGSVYRSPRSHLEAIEELRACAGQQFDPQLVERFVAELEASDSSRSKSFGPASRDLVHGITEGATNLAKALEEKDTMTVADIARQMKSTAEHHHLTDLATAAQQLEEATAEDLKMVELVATADGLLDLCRQTQLSYLNSCEATS